MFAILMARAHGLQTKGQRGRAGAKGQAAMQTSSTQVYAALMTTNSCGNCLRASNLCKMS